MNIEIVLLLVLILLVIFCFYQKKQENFVSGNIYSELKDDPEKMNTVRRFFENLTLVDNDYYLNGKKFNCVTGDKNIIPEDYVID